MNLHRAAQLMRDRGHDPDEVEAFLSELADRQMDEARDYELTAGRQSQHQDEEDETNRREVMQ